MAMQKFLILFTIGFKSQKYLLFLMEKCQNLKSFLKKNEKKINLIFTDLNTKNKKIELNKNDKKALCIIIGPEGDFSEKERKLILESKKTISISLAKNILRAETAAIAATTILSYNLANN